MIKAILLDCGGVLVSPTTGDWGLGPGYEEILGSDFATKHLDAFRAARRDHLHLLPDTNRIDSDEVEREMFVAFYRATLAKLGITLPEEDLARLAWIQTHRDDRYLLFDDVLPYLDKWRAQGYKLGIVSDAPPSTRRIMTSMGVTARMDGDTYSCDLGVIKPDPAMYRRTLDLLGLPPEDAVFIDDLPKNLRGAQALGIRGVQMLRPMPPLFSAAPPWDGPIVHDFAQLDALLPSL